MHCVSDHSGALSPTCIIKGSGNPKQEVGVALLTITASAPPTHTHLGSAGRLPPDKDPLGPRKYH